MNWGIKIILLLAGFVTLVLFMVSRAVMQDFHLVADNYYEREVKYQEEIDRISKARNLSEPVSITYSPDEKAVYIFFPGDQKEHIQGSVYFYRPSDSSLDREVNIDPDIRNRQRISVKSLDKGLWRIKVTWSFGGEEFQEEKNIFFQ